MCASRVGKPDARWYIRRTGQLDQPETSDSFKQRLRQRRKTATGFLPLFVFLLEKIVRRVCRLHRACATAWQVADVCERAD